MQASRSVVYKGAEYSIRTGAEGGPFFVLGVRKSGSSVLNSIVQALAEQNGLNYVDVAGKLFEAGVPVPEWQADPSLIEIVEPGNVYGGFRNAPTAFYPAQSFRRGRKILMVRDPRDALVSEYFSNAYSHSIPKGGDLREDMLSLREAALHASIDQYVLDMAPSLRRVLRQYMVIAHDANCRLFRYEDVFLQKRRLIEEICVFFGWTLPPQAADNILRWADVLPTEERPTEFVRRVTPGDHREKLSGKVIERLNTLFAEEMAHYGYAA